jgi:hypothetical protein
MPPTGAIDRTTWSALFAAPSAAVVAREDFASITRELMKPHQFRDSVSWSLTQAGIAINGLPATGSPGMPSTVQGILQRFGSQISAACAERAVFIELVVATIATESSGRPEVRREEPGFISDEQTPDRVSVGLMQTLISTARSATADHTIDAATLATPAGSIKAGTAYIAKQFGVSGFDPPKVACAYNAGGIYYNPSANNRWKMRQFPIGTARHADRFVSFFNDCFCLLSAGGGQHPMHGPSFAAEFVKIRGH